MKSYFVGWILAVAILGFSGVAQGKNLQLILEGPFVVCENVNEKNLTIAIPYVQGTHNAPGFTSDLGDLSLGTDSSGGLFGSLFHIPTDKLRTTITWSNSQQGHHRMALNPRRKRNQEPPAYFYSEKGDCSHVNMTMESVAVTVPVPDEVWTVSPTQDTLFITDANDRNKYGECSKGDGCPHATKLVLRYKHPNLNSLKIESKCQARQCTTNDSWNINTSVAIGGEFEFELSAQPINVTDEHAHAIAAFHAASSLSELDRKLNFTTFKKRDPGSHRVCQIPPVVLCTSYAAGGACPKN